MGEDVTIVQLWFAVAAAWWRPAVELFVNDHGIRRELIRSADGFRAVVC